MPPLKKVPTSHVKGAAKFASVGAVNALTDMTVYAGAIAVGLSPVSANVVGFACANLQSYFLNSAITFRRDGKAAAKSVRGYAKFCGAHLFGLALSTAIVFFFADRLGPYLAKGLAIGAGFFCNYFFSALLIFRTPSDRRGA